MSERAEQRQGSPLDSERGTTTIEDAVVKRIAGRAANEVEGIHMGGNAARGAGGLLGRATGSSGDETRGVSVEVGRIETAVDLTMAVDYDRNILQVVGRVREKVEERIRSLTGLRITELNVTVSDILFPDGGGGQSGRRGELAAGGSSDDDSEDDTAPVRPREPVSRERTGREDVHVEGTPVDEGETAELRLGEDVRKRSSGERGEGRGERGGEGRRDR
ncbi:Asp23/Gls24 family envelope stress response protein [Rubrobacter marinus]|uniref:Asp23/Gls24 family envelope stress response protein n=1 Tax=Rubrobacter marinus TaxID=2653852 RepID=A0A6G8Q1K9_9ACTN|nr:Asp23/Gls24 family envelope stress response protein [Rubrobacter marinus]QIN80300.1 Asp23/Gls24 family envelope stress response protein [Rubrobacter marinus]